MLLLLFIEIWLLSNIFAATPGHDASEEAGVGVDERSRMISYERRHRLIYARVRQMNEKHAMKAGNGTIAVPQPIPVATIAGDDRNGGDTVVGEEEIVTASDKTNNRARVNNSLPAPLPSSPIVQSRAVKTSSTLKEPSISIGIGISETSASDSEEEEHRKSFVPPEAKEKDVAGEKATLLCLPKMPPPPPPFLPDSRGKHKAPPHEVSHPPPMWLALLPGVKAAGRARRSISAAAATVSLLNSNYYSSRNGGSDRVVSTERSRSITITERIDKIQITTSSKSGESATLLKRMEEFKERRKTVGGSRKYVREVNHRRTNLEQRRRQDFPPRIADLQIVHPAAPHEKDWVLTAGNESAVDNVLSISLSYGGRLVSMGYYRDEGWSTLRYYTIMHRFSGPVFLKPNPISFADLMKMAHENEELDMALTQLCGQEDATGRVLFNTYWERIPGIWFPGSLEAEKQRNLFEDEGYRLVSICGYSVKKEARYVGVWQRPVLRVTPYEAHFGLSLKECLSVDERMRAKDFVATQFRVFNNDQDILCAGIWEYIPGRRHFIEIGENLRQMHDKHLMARSRLPRQISHFVDAATRRVKYVVLWSNVHSFRYPIPPDVWLNRVIPVSYLAGTQGQLDPAQLDFISKRVERFMRELDIPGLSVAISRDEQLKFAAGFGYGNVRRREPVTPDNQFRIGSVSKPITATAILILAEHGRLRLDQLVFGGGGDAAGSIFGDQFAINGRYAKYVTEITVRHLLEHTSGGWNNVDNDPAWLEPNETTERLIRRVIHQQPLRHRPGRVWIYSNFGYQLLGHIVHQLSGRTYEQFVLENVWRPVGVTNIQVARPTLSEKTSREVLYYMSGHKIGFNPYEMLPPERTGPWGGWIASPIELLKLMSRIDGFQRKPDILSERSLREITTASRASNETYGLGWSLNIMGFNGWQHDGRMPGSASMLVRLDNGLEMAVIVNKEYSERDFFHELGYILHHIGNNCDWWKNNSVDLFTLYSSNRPNNSAQ